MALLTLRTLYFLSRNTVSIGNFIKKVWIEEQGFINSPSPGSRECRFNKPTALLFGSWAMVTLVATICPFVSFITL